MIATTAMQLAHRVAEAAARIPGVVAISLGGSAASGLADAQSDIDLHVFWREPLADAAARAALLTADNGALPGLFEELIEDLCALA
jgi:predicted nucleotidyltransferase